MDIVAFSMMKSKASVKQGVSIALMKQTMNLATEQHSTLLESMVDIKAMEQAVQPHMGSHIDIKL